MKRILLTALQGPVVAVVIGVAGLLALGCSAVVEPGPGGPRGQGQEKVFVCHKGKKTLEVAEAALAAHLKHGDTRGRCRQAARR